MKLISTLALGLALVASPALAQSAPADGGFKMRHQGRMFSQMSPEGQEIMRNAMRGLADPDARGEVRAARDRVSQILAADRLDRAALERAMDEERRLVDAQHQRRQDAMVNAFTQLSAADRKAFVAEARSGRDRVEQRMKTWRDRRAAAGAGS
jgi:uncharacterized membrane protein